MNSLLFMYNTTGISVRYGRRRGISRNTWDWGSKKYLAYAQLASNALAVEKPSARGKDEGPVKD